MILRNEIFASPLPDLTNAVRVAGNFAIIGFKATAIVSSGVAGAAVAAGGVAGTSGFETPAGFAATEAVGLAEAGCAGGAAFLAACGGGGAGCAGVPGCARLNLPKKLLI